MPTRKYILEGSAKVCNINYGEPIKVKVKISMPKIPSWLEKENKKNDN